MRDQVTAATLTNWLRQSGSLGSGAVVDVAVERELDTTISTLTFITVKYSADVSTALPHKLVVKSPHPVPALRDQPSAESFFYRHVAPRVSSPPVVQCLAALSGDADAQEIIVLEDLRGTHDQPPWPLPPSRADCERWEAETLGDTVGRLHTEESLTSMVHGIAAHLAGFMDTLGDALSLERRRVLERVFGSSLKPWLRLTDTHALTLAHGDAHTWNFLFPRSGDGAAYLFDWQLWHLDVGARDLAFLMALHWYRERRRDVELPLLRYYHEQLSALGCSGYSFDELWLDYRRCVVRNLTFPIILWSRGMQPEAWWHRLECALGAYDDLACDELL